MRIDPLKQSQKENYKLLIGAVLPRPIAFVSSLNEQGKVNAAPFSFFTVVSTDPPMLAFVCSRKSNGERKDTVVNIEREKEFVIHVVSEEIVEKVNNTSIEFPHEVSEVEEVGFSLLPSEVVKVPRIAESRIQMECRLEQIVPFGNSEMVVGRVVQFHVDDELYENGRINTEKLKPVGRLAGLYYGKVGEMFAMPRLSLEEWNERKGK
jgi:flavin reductase (DIM6/NTAB) family NADH-FMN oxidoreductase RutF